MISKDDIYSCNIFLNSVIPLLKVIAESEENFIKAFKNKSGVIQVSVLNEEEKLGTYLVVDRGQWKVSKGLAEKADVELQFSSIPHLNLFFKGKTKKMPKIKGFKNPSLLINTFKVLLRMSSLLSAKVPPKDEKDKSLLVKLNFYILSSGISQLNKSGHPEISTWAQRSPDRVYAWAVNGRPELSAYIRVKAGRTKASKGEYRRAKPFFTMRFDSVDSALGILMSTDDLIKSTIEKKLIMEGAPEFGAQLGDFMMIVGNYAK